MIASNFTTIFSVVIVILVCLLSLSYLVYGKKILEKKEEKEIKAKTIRYFFWYPEKRCLELFSESGDRLIILAPEDSYKIQARTRNSTLSTVRFVLGENGYLVHLFYVDYPDNFSLKSIMDAVGIKSIHTEN